jgi:hypothetical protein
LRIQGSLAQNSVRWAAFENQDTQTWWDGLAAANGTGIHAKRIREWNEEWEHFFQWIVDEYGGSWNKITYSYDLGRFLERFSSPWS